MICKKAMKIAMGVGMVLCATTSFAAVEQGFESASVGAIHIISRWVLQLQLHQILLLIPFSLRAK